MQTDCPEIAGGRWQFGARGSVASALSSSRFEFVGVVRPFTASLQSSREGRFAHVRRGSESVCRSFEAPEFSGRRSFRGAGVFEAPEFSRRRSFRGAGVFEAPEFSRRRSFRGAGVFED